jgi:hypothetical protein
MENDNKSPSELPSEDTIDANYSRRTIPLVGLGDSTPAPAQFRGPRGLRGMARSHGPSPQYIPPSTTYLKIQYDTKTVDDTERENGKTWCGVEEQTTNTTTKDRPGPYKVLLCTNVTITHKQPTYALPHANHPPPK